MNRWLLLVLWLSIVSGCGPSVPSGVIVKGKLVKGGSPVAPPPDGSGSAPQVTIVSTTTAEDGTSAGGQAGTDANGEFRIVAGGKGVPPGKYRMQLQAEGEPGQDLFEGKFTGENFMQEIEVPADKVGSELDLGTIELDDVKPITIAAPAPSP